MEKTIYKNISLPPSLIDLIAYMTDVEEYREELRTLGGQWDLLTILGQMSGAGSDMSSTQDEFQSLTDELIGQLGLETMKKNDQEIEAIAQVAVDILIRNLFERTADIGFLATDEDIRQFLLGDGAEKTSMKRNLISRFQEYVAKYSVYHDIILLNTSGKILVRLDEDATVTESSDPLVEEALETCAEYVEIYRYTDLAPQNDKSLVYAYRVTENNDPESDPIGVLCLCFRFENEMEGIFSNLLSPEDWSVISILDSDGRVIASSDPYQLPHGAVLDRVLDERSRIVRFGGREYLAKTCATKGYQGFMGLGWYGHAMLPLSHAFKSTKSNSLSSNVDQLVLEAVMKAPQMFSKELRHIPIKADQIQKDLNRTVWNGNVKQTTTQSKVLLWNIAAAGEKTKQVFESSIGNLHQTVVSAILEDVAFQAALAVDIMDRNLYERANDCRWWALTSAFGSILSKREISEERADIITDILRYINGLYTVYTNLFVYDVNGKVIAVSTPDENNLVGKILKNSWVNETLELTDTQAYSVSIFEPTPLYKNKHTYIYGASIARPGNSNEIVGGIGIVFDSEPQFEAMLQDSLPRNEQGKVRKGLFAIFCDRKRKVISSTSQDISIGDTIDIDNSFFESENGSGYSKLIEFKGKYYAVGSRTSSGYREYKRKDNYRNDVIALVFVPLATAIKVSDNKAVEFKGPNFDFSESDSELSIELATFSIKDHTYAFRTENIHKAIGVEGLTEIPGSHELLSGKITDENRVVPVIDFARLKGEDHADCHDSSQIIILKTPKGLFGITVDALGPIPSIPKDRIDFNATLLDAADQYTEGVMLPPEAESHTQMVVILDAERVYATVEKLGTFSLNNKDLDPDSVYENEDSFCEN